MDTEPEARQAWDKRVSDSLNAYVREKAALADKSAREWDEADAKQQAAYRAGMWYAYRDIERQLGPARAGGGRPCE